MKKILIIITFFCSFISLKAQPNATFELLESKDDIDIYYKWKKKFPYGKEADRNLIFYIDNKSNKNRVVSFSVDIFKNAIRHSSTGVISYCLPGDYEIYGRFKNLAFDTGLTWEEIESKEIIWEINEFKVEDYVGDCKSSSNWVKTENKGN